MSAASERAQHPHTPVLLDRCVELLAPACEAPRSVVVDCTLGMGGHAEAILERIPTARVLGIDRDPVAIEHASRRLSRFGDRFRAVHAVYDQLGEVLGELGARDPGWGATTADHTVQGVLLDLGVSSLQLDQEERGFSYSHDAPLDMRMDGSTGPTAADVLNDYDAAALTRVLRDYGEERFAARIAARIVRRREIAPWARTGELADLVREAIPAATRHTGGHPAKRTFQALRIEVNGELDALARALPQAIDALAVGGRIVVESYQSLEDRMVKRALAAGAQVRTPAGIPVVPEADQPYLALLVRGAERAGPHEIGDNPRSAPVRLRAAERIRTTRHTKQGRTS